MVNAPLHDVRRSRESAIYRGTVFALDEIEIAARVLAASIKTLREAHTEQRPVNVKLAAEQNVKVAMQIQVLSNTLVQTFSSHLVRRPR